MNFGCICVLHMYCRHHSWATMLPSASSISTWQHPHSGELMVKVFLALIPLISLGDQVLSGTNCVYLTQYFSCYWQYTIIFCSQNICSDRWRNRLLAADSSPATIFDALSSWLTLTGSGQVYYTDTCQGTLCTCTHACRPIPNILTSLLLFIIQHWKLGMGLEMRLHLHVCTFT